MIEGTGWRGKLSAEFEKEYYKKLILFVREEDTAYTIYPPKAQRFNAYNLTPFENVKVVILGQDPYHGPNQAHGLAFSVPAGVAHPPSLKNILKELQEDVGCPISENGTLTRWAEQGVLLLNTVLTVRAGQAHSHKGRGWEEFTDATIRLVNEQKEHIVFILWGKPAQQKAALIDETRHLIIRAPHPSPLSSYRGFFGSKPFSKTNSYLVENGISPIDWTLSS